jgi:polygalacturonase
VSIQDAINACNPGDILLIPRGKYVLNNGLTLKSDMTVNLSPNALLQANTDGGGLVYNRNKGTQPGRGIQIVESSNITLRNVTVSNIPTFGVDFQKSDTVTVDAVKIRGCGFNRHFSWLSQDHV